MLPLHQRSGESLKDHPPSSQGILAQMTRFVRLRTTLFRKQSFLMIAVGLLCLYVFASILSTPEPVREEVNPNFQTAEKVIPAQTQKPARVEENNEPKQNHIEEVNEPLKGDGGVAKEEKKEENENQEPQVNSPENEIRRKAVHDAFMHAWGAYRDHAFGHDELDPSTCTAAGNWMNMGLTLVDSLDVLWIMGEKDEFQKARDWVASSLNFDQNRYVSFFETIIRILGGLLSAYDLSGDKIFVEKASELADRLLYAFNTPTGIPHASINLVTHQGHSPSWTGGSSILSEISSVQLEFNYLSKVTGNPEYGEKSLKVFDILDKTNSNDGLYPIFISSSSGGFTTNLITLGAMGDSFYEYEIKLFYQTGDKKYLDMYRKSTEGIRKHLLQKTTPSRLTYLCDMDGGRKAHKMDHLACFASAMFAIGAEQFGDEAQTHLQIAEELAETCHEMYKRQATGVAPEYIRIVDGKDFVNGADHNLLRPETVESYFVLWRLTHNQKYRDWGWEAFQAFEKYARVDCGYAGIRDVTSTFTSHDDKMQSFFLAETLKYLYLLFSPDDVIPLDKYIFNTEAHPLRKFASL